MSDVIQAVEVKGPKQMLKNKRPKMDEMPMAPVETEVEKLKREAQEAAQKDGEARAKACGEEIAPILEKHRCAIIGQPHYKHMGDGVWGTVTSPVIIAKP